MTIKVISKFFRSISVSLLLIFFLAQPCLAETFSIAQDDFNSYSVQELEKLHPKSYAFPLIQDLANPIIIGGIYTYCITRSEKTMCDWLTLFYNIVPYSLWTLPSDYYVQTSKTKKIVTPIMKLLINGLIITAIRIDFEINDCDNDKNCDSRIQIGSHIWLGTLMGISIIEAVYHGFKVHEYNENLEKEKAKRLTLTPIPTANGVGVGLSMSF